MARRDVFQNITNINPQEVERKTTPGYGARGASRNMMSSIEELAEKAAQVDQFLESDVISEIDPSLIDASFVTDRLSSADEAFDELIEAIKTHGQKTPILLRPHPVEEGRYQVVFGHRRVQASRILGQKVKAVIKSVSDIEHVIAQGQENSARENLSFIERAVFAQQLYDKKYERAVIQSALSIDAPMLTRMLSVTNRVPIHVISSVGPAKTVGRDRWTIFAQLIENPQGLEAVNAEIASLEFSTLLSEERFEKLCSILKKIQLTRRKRPKEKDKEIWNSSERDLYVEILKKGKKISLVLGDKEARRFGQFIMSNIDTLYTQFKTTISNEEK